MFMWSSKPSALPDWLLFITKGIPPPLPPPHRNAVQHPNGLRHTSFVAWGGSRTLNGAGRKYAQAADCRARAARQASGQRVEETAGGGRVVKMSSAAKCLQMTQRGLPHEALAWERRRGGRGASKQAGLMKNMALGFSGPPERPRRAAHVLRHLSRLNSLPFVRFIFLTQVASSAV